MAPQLTGSQLTGSQLTGSQLTGTPLLIYESGDRWRRTAEAWLRTHPALAESFLVRSATLGEIRALATQVRPLVLLWELPFAAGSQPAPQLAEVVRSIRLLANQAAAPLQLLAVPLALDLPAEQDLELEIYSRQLGVDFVVKAPEQMVVGWRLVLRYQAGYVANRVNAERRTLGF